MNESINENTCIVCFNQILDKDLCKTNCNHIYCEDCLITWFDRGNVECPMCRVPVKSYQNDGLNNRIVTVKTRERENNAILIQTDNLDAIRSLYKRYNYLRLYFLFNTGYLIYLQYRNYILYNDCHH